MDDIESLKIQLEDARVIIMDDNCTIRKLLADLKNAKDFIQVVRNCLYTQWGPIEDALDDYDRDFYEKSQEV